MTSFINFVTTNFIGTSKYGALTDGIAILAVVILLALLVEKVLLEAYNGKPIEYKTHAFTVVVLPLLFVVALVVFLRVAQILPLW